MRPIILLVIRDFTQWCKVSITFICSSLTWKSYVENCNAFYFLFNNINALFKLNMMKGAASLAILLNVVHILCRTYKDGKYCSLF